MKWVTRERVKVDRVACPWLIERFVDPQAEFAFVPPEQVLDLAIRENAIPYDVSGAEFGKHGQECSFDAIIKKYGLDSDPALVLMGRIIGGADLKNPRRGLPESAGLNAIAEGFRHLGFKSDHEQIAAEKVVYDALFAYCQCAIAQHKPDGMFRNHRHQEVGV